MVQLVLHLLGTVLLFAPFLLIRLFQDKIKGFVYICTTVFVFHIFVSLLTQALQTFTYPLILLLHGIVAVISVVVYVRFPHSPKKVSEPQPLYKKFLALLPYVAGFIIFMQLFSVHYNYSGVISTYEGYQRIERSAYSYPYFSDEWVGVALSQYSMASKSLPTVNPLYFNAPYPNVLLVYFSLISEVFLLLGLFPLIGYPIVAIGGGLLLIFLITVFLKQEKVGSFSLLLTALLVPYIVNGANLPGIWYLLPFNVSFILFVMALILMAKKDMFTLVPAFLSILIYPPIAVFVVPSVLTYFVIASKTSEKRVLINRVMWVFASIVLLGGVLMLVLSLVTSLSFTRIGSIISSFIIRTNQLQNGIPQFALWNVMPLMALFFAGYGIWKKGISRLWLTIPIIVGGIFWVAYAFTTRVVIIDYPRVVMITAWLLMIFAGYGLHYLLLDLQQREWKGKITKKIHEVFQRNWAHTIFQFLIVFIFLVMASGYTARTNWLELQLNIKSEQGTAQLLPGAPANRYLTSEDIQIFSPFSRQVFIAPSWKGLVLGAATGNYPLDSKAATIGNQFVPYADFMNGDCVEKNSLASKWNLTIAYTEPFTCPNFTELSRSAEGLVLYGYRP